MTFTPPYKPMIFIDGSQGEGGGQVLRSSLALALVTGNPVTIENIRARRSKPGLAPQHLTAVHAAQAVCDAKLQGAEIGSTRLVLEPGPLRGGEYRFDTGTAGSTTLVLQTILPALLAAPAASHVWLEGGTHNPLAPPFDFLAHAFLPLARRMGAAIEPGACAPGFYPAGGGGFDIRIQPTRQLQSFDLLNRGKLVECRVKAIVANLPDHIARRECRTIAALTDWPQSCFSCERVDSRGPGNVVLIELQHEHVTEVFTAFGQRGKRAEQVAREGLRQAQDYLESGVPVGPYLADQLMLLMALAAHQGQRGSFRSSPLSSHSLTQLDILPRFLNVTIQVTSSNNEVLVGFEPATPD